MPIQRLNHAVLFVSDLERSPAFHRDASTEALCARDPDGIECEVRRPVPDAAVTGELPAMTSPARSTSTPRSR
ncbi:hypothetical protein GCM10010275_15830 [Streptomyces litmocidini]|uniref:hypothetical protein n=1 Tax=Streptomyces litmocidini TaxID=67318 RepID=UPI00167D80F5|nr:hypothetical protein [Streptomyces litmocidini]GGU81690.1 hypothetical protein GCM10010275_15830 [Streptomyces litmocidini]